MYWPLCSFPITMNELSFQYFLSQHLSLLLEPTGVDKGNKQPAKTTVTANSQTPLSIWPRDRTVEFSPSQIQLSTCPLIRARLKAASSPASPAFNKSVQFQRQVQQRTRHPRAAVVKPFTPSECVPRRQKYSTFRVPEDTNRYQIKTNSIISKLGVNHV